MHIVSCYRRRKHAPGGIIWGVSNLYLALEGPWYPYRSYIKLSLTWFQTWLALSSERSVVKYLRQDLVVWADIYEEAIFVNLQISFISACIWCMDYSVFRTTIFIRVTLIEMTYPLTFPERLLSWLSRSLKKGCIGLGGTKTINV